MITLEPFRREFKSPGKNDRKGEPDKKKQQEDVEYPGWSSNVVQNNICYLHYEPRHNDIGDSYPEYITALELVE